MSINPFRLVLTLIIVFAVFGVVLFRIEQWSLEIISLEIGDEDQDGMYDTWERAAGLDPKQRDNKKDLDGDGLTNYQEFLLRTSPRRLDSDRDGMPDGWEYWNHLKPRMADSSGDADQDELSNLEEFRHQANPQNRDTDADGMADGWEVKYKLHPLREDADYDTDGDRKSDLEEYQAHTDPTDYFNGLEAPVITIVSGEGSPTGEFVVRVHKPDGTPYENAPVTITAPPDVELAGHPDSTNTSTVMKMRTDEDGLVRVYLRPAGVKY